MAESARRGSSTGAEGPAARTRRRLLHGTATEVPQLLLLLRSSPRPTRLALREAVSGSGGAAGIRARIRGLLACGLSQVKVHQLVLHATVHRGVLGRQALLPGPLGHLVGAQLLLQQVSFLRLFLQFQSIEPLQRVFPAQVGLLLQVSIFLLHLWLLAL